MGNVIQLPSIDDLAMKPGEWEELMVSAHAKLMDALQKSQTGRYRESFPVVLSIDDVVEICQVIEQRLGHEWFQDEGIED